MTLPTETSSVDDNPGLTLPNETLNRIFKVLTPTALVSVSCVSQRFNAVAERILYSSVHIVDGVSAQSPAPLKTIAWCESMVKRFYLIDMLRKVHIRWQSDGSSPPPHYFIASCERLGEVLSLLTQLESLELFLGPANLLSSHNYEPIHAAERVIKRCHFTHIWSCSLGADYTKAAQPYTSILVSFLALHPCLRHLKIPDLHSALHIPTTALPNLSTFRGSADTAASLLPGRPVQFLSLIGQDSEVNRENLPRMTCTSVPLQGLDLSAMTARPMLLRNVATYLPTLQTLRVKLALRHTLHYSFSGIRILAGLSAVLSAFTELLFLDLSPTDVGGIGRADSLEELSLCKEWHRACQTLRRIIFPSESEWILNDYGIWSSV